MKNRIIAIAAIGTALVGSGAIGYSAYAQERGRRERHPELMRALRALNNAEKNLAHAAHDFQGHRAKALELTEEAIEQDKIAIQLDKH